MFETIQARGSAPFSTAALEAALSALAGPVTGEDPGVLVEELVEELAGLERVKQAISARQARVVVAFDRVERERQKALGEPAERAGRGVGDQVGLALRQSPARGSRFVGFAKALGEMPHTFDHLQAGRVSEWVAGQAVAETAFLARADREAVDAELSEGMPGWSPRRVRAMAWKVACRLDPAGAVKRNARAVNERRVWVRPAPEAMTYVGALLPMKDGVAMYAALKAAATTRTAPGDTRGQGQMMADTLVERVTNRPAQHAPRPPEGSKTDPETSSARSHTGGRDARPPAATTSGATPPAGPTPVAETTPVPARASVDDVPAGPVVEVHLVMSDDALFNAGPEPALVTSSDPSGSNPAAGHLPAALARELVREGGAVFVRRLFTRPDTGELVAMDSRRRVFDGHLRRMLILRDQTCRTPWCDAPIRHGDHVRDFARGGVTSYDNGQGLCERCNQTKNLPGWNARVLNAGPDPGGGHAVRTTTPTGHTYDSTAPPLLSARAVSEPATGTPVVLERSA